MNKAAELARLSLEKVSSSDKSGWLALFDSDAVVYDPYGASEFDPEGTGHRGIEAISAFWELAIEGNKITGEIHKSYEAGDSCANVMTTRTQRSDTEVWEVSSVGIYRASTHGKLLSITAYWNFDQINQNA